MKKLSNNQQPQTDTHELIIDTKHLKDQKDIADTFNNHKHWKQKIHMVMMRSLLKY
jgi:hypothetical protein